MTVLRELKYFRGPWSLSSEWKLKCDFHSLTEWVFFIQNLNGSYKSFRCRISLLLFVTKYCIFSKNLCASKCIYSSPDWIIFHLRFLSSFDLFPHPYPPFPTYFSFTYSSHHDTKIVANPTFNFWGNIYIFIGEHKQTNIDFIFLTSKFCCCRKSPIEADEQKPISYFQLVSNT